MIKWQTRWPFSSNKIEQVECSRETDKTLWICSHRAATAERQVRKRTDYEQYHDTWEAAQAFVVSALTRKISSLQSELDKYHQQLQIVQALVKPEELGDVSIK